MKKTIHYIALIAFVFAAAVPAYAQSRPRRNNAAGQRAAKQRAAAAAARAKADSDAEKRAQENYNTLHQYVPNVTLAELKGMSATDLRNLYTRSYMAQGMKMLEAKEKAAAMKF